jgi:RimJ/RimL family protein N-acetyltransferase
MKTNDPAIQLLPPNVERDVPFTLSWFERPEGRDTLLSMGNAEHEIEPATRESERGILREFIELEEEQKQITRMIVVNHMTIGVVWIELQENHGVHPPSIHIMIGNPDYRGKGIGKSVMQAAINYVRDDLHMDTIYSRHLANNTAVASLNQSLGFEKDGSPFTDKNGLVWQGIKKKL